LSTLTYEIVRNKMAVIATNPITVVSY